MHALFNDVFMMILHRYIDIMNESYTKEVKKAERRKFSFGAEAAYVMRKNVEKEELILLPHTHTILGLLTFSDEVSIIIECRI